MGKEQLTEKNYVRCEGVLVGVDFHTPRERPNGLRISRAAPLDRDSAWAKSSFQNRRDLGAA